MDQEHFPGRSLAPASPRPGSALARSPPAAPLPRASGAARGTAIALAQIDEPPMPIYCARQPRWSRGTSGWSQPRAPGASAAEPAQRGGEREGGRRPAASAARPPPGPRPAGFPGVNRAALRERGRPAACATDVLYLLGVTAAT